MKGRAYLYGMIVLSTIHKLKNAYPEVDSYGEIAQTFVCPGGETMNAAILLSRLGMSSTIGGPHWGHDTREVLTSYAEKYSIDYEGIVMDESYPGVKDLILVDDRHRTVFGYFGGYFSDSVQRWSEPDRKEIEHADIVAIDPFFREASVHAAEICAEYGRPYVTIDCRADSYLHRHCAANVVAREYRAQEYRDEPDEKMFGQYIDSTDGLVVFTSGKSEIMYGRKGYGMRKLSPYRVEVRSTLGAGDTFRAGIVFGLSQKWEDERTVRFASALAALVCTRMPIADNPPSLEEVESFISRGGDIR